MPVKIIPKGTRYGRLTTTGNYEIKSRRAFWECECDCGKRVFVRGSALKNGTTKSCGCYKIELQSKKMKKHNMSHTRIHGIWCNMRCRCNKEYEPTYVYYGARGIKVCPEWDNTNDGFQNFYEWALENGYSDNLTLDRVDVNGNYEPLNCRWVDMKTQNRNKRNNHYINVNGEKMILTDVAEMLGITRAGILQRIDRGMSVEEAVSKPKEIQDRKYVYYQGKNMTLKEFSEETGIKVDTLVSRMYRGHTSANELMMKNLNDLKCKVVNKYDANNSFIECYKSANEAARKNKCSHTSIVQCCNGKLKKVKGNIYKYA